MCATKPMALKMTVVTLACNGIPCASSTGMMYGIQTIMPENSTKNCKATIKMNGFSERFRLNSLNLSQNVGFGCVHFINCFAQVAHAFEISL